MSVLATQEKKRVDKYVMFRHGQRRKRPDSELGFRSKLEETVNIYCEPKQEKKSASNTVFFQKQKLKKDNEGRIAKDYQEIVEENMKLKSENHRLRKDLAIIKGKVEVSRKRNERRSNVLELQFQKQLYWTGSKTHLISGIKYQYDMLKKKYEQLRKENIQLKRNTTFTREAELVIYTQNLEMENKRLEQLLKSEQWKVIQENLDEKLRYHMKQIKKKYFQKENQVQESKRIIKEKQTEIKKGIEKAQFLEQRLIEKENKQCHWRQKQRKLEKDKVEIGQKLKDVQKRMRDMSDTHKQQLNKLGEDVRMENEKERVQLQKQILRKERKIGQLEEDKRYLEEKLNDAQNFNNKSLLDIKMMASKTDEAKLKASIRKTINQSAVSFKMPTYHSIISQIAQDKQEEKDITPRPRVFKSSNERQSQEGQRTRKVDVTQVHQISQFLKYKMIGLNINISKLKSFFDSPKLLRDYILEENDLTNNELDEIGWQQMYINMRQMEEILKAEPFQLNENDARILGRYMIEEDNGGGYVYYDLVNEQKREVVKSIICSLVGEYKLVCIDPEVQDRVDQMMLRYKVNIGANLGAVFPKGEVPKKKFLDIVKSVASEGNPEIQDYLVAKLTLQSTALTALRYQSLFPHQD